jgi:hypothetical protein
VSDFFIRSPLQYVEFTEIPGQPEFGKPASAAAMRQPTEEGEADSKRKGSDDAV